MGGRDHILLLQRLAGERLKICTAAQAVSWEATPENWWFGLFQTKFISSVQ